MTSTCRKKKAPILFTLSPVEYDEKTKKLKLPTDVFVGNVIARGSGRCSLGKLQDKIDELVDVTEEETGEDEQLHSGKLKLKI